MKTYPKRDSQKAVRASLDFLDTISGKRNVYDEANYQAWKAQVGLAERGDVDEQTIRNMWDAIDDEDK